MRVLRLAGYFCSLFNREDSSVKELKMDEMAEAIHEAQCISVKSLMGLEFQARAFQAAGVQERRNPGAVRPVMMPPCKAIAEEEGVTVSGLDSDFPRSYVNSVH